MKIVLNFLPLKSGGGVQVGLDFIAQAKKHGRIHNWCLVATDETPFASLEEEPNFKLVRLVPRSLLRRLFFEYFEAKRLVRDLQPDVIYTQFGPHWPGTRVRNVAGCAYSNLFYPEIDFWGSCQLFINKFRTK